MTKVAVCKYRKRYKKWGEGNTESKRSGSKNVREKC